MKILKFDKQIHVIKTDKFNTIDFILVYPSTYKKEDMGNFSLMRQNVLNSSKKFPIEQEYKKEYQKSFIIGYDVKSIRFNTNLFIEASLTVPNPKKVKSFDLDKAFEFFMDTIYFPNVTNDKFNEYQFYREKEFVQNSMENASKNIREVGYQNFLTYIDDNGILKDNLYHNRHLLDEVTPESLYTFYKENVLQNNPMILVYGDIEEDKVRELFSKYIDINPKTIEINKNYDCYLAPRKETQYIEENSSFKQSALYMGYKVLNMKDEDKIYLRLLSRILDGGENDLIFKALRLEHNLVYSVSMSSYYRNGMVFIETHLNESSKDEAIKTIKTTLNQLRDSAFVKGCLDKILIANKYNLIRRKDSKYSVLDDYLDKLAEFEETLEEIYEKYKHLEIDKFLEFLDRVILDTVYFLRGDDSEK